jgi:hypothetical protein
VQVGLPSGPKEKPASQVTHEHVCFGALQVPQFILDAAVESGQGAACSIVCTQPRRIAAISVAERVAAERGEPAPGSPGAHVGCAATFPAAVLNSKAHHAVDCDMFANFLNTYCMPSKLMVCMLHVIHGGWVSLICRYYCGLTAACLHAH